MTIDLFIGIASGIIATFVAVLISRFFRGIVIPFVKSLLFDIPTISGQWQTYDTKDGEPVGKAIIKQRSRQLAMQITRTTDRQGQATNKTFVYDGKFASGILAAYYEDIEMKGYIMGAVVMRLLPDNKTLQGKTVYFDHNQGQVVAHEYWLRR